MRSASVLSAQDEHEKALSIYTGIIEKYPGHELAGRALYNQSRTLQSLGRYRRAVETLRKIEQPLSEQMEAEINLLEADCLFQLGDYEEALLGYLKTAYLYPLHEAIVLISLESAAKILRVLERDDEAAKIYKKIIKLDPEGIKGEMASQKLREVGK